MIVSLLLALVACAFCFICSLYFCYMLQLQSYQTDGYYRWLGGQNSSGMAYFVGLGILYTVAAYMITLNNSNTALTIGIVLMALFAGLGALLIVSLNRSNVRKMVYTARVKRLLATEILVLVLCAVVAMFGQVAVLGLLIIMTPVLIVVMNYLNKPIEKSINNKYLNEAKQRLEQRPQLIKIGITGSYGKTSTKFILGTILGEKYNVLVPPSSYNTPMGLTRVIREQLTDAHQVFLAEMGARHVGDIAELIDLVHPQYGILTSVGPQHLETFGDIETVADTKYELIEGLPEDGCAFFINDGAFVKQLYDKTQMNKRLYALADEHSEGDVSARDITSGPEGSTFTVQYKNGAFVAQTKMLGKHNVLNIIGCVAIALELGLSEEQIKAGIAKIEPVEHRLQLIPSNNGVTVIDDAFNANPEGTRAAMEVIKSFPGRKIVVTPGMVELGEEEDAQNYLFGERMAAAADLVFLVGPNHTKPIYEGLQSAGFDMEQVFVVNSLAEASAKMGPMLSLGDVVLFENDLPDNYNEA